MSQRIPLKAKKNRRLTYLWIFGLALLVFLLIYFEQTALLYVFSTLGVTVLLVIVAAADLGRSELSATDSSPISSAATRGKPAK
jgi:Na+-transporting NADH:ubiquinone oxidoreductase subunit NqrD